MVSIPKKVTFGDLVYSDSPLGFVQHDGIAGEEREMLAEIRKKYNFQVAKKIASGK